MRVAEGAKPARSVRSSRGLGLAAVLCVGWAGAALAEAPFAAFQGEWRGTGDVSLSDGSHESIRCTARYAPNQGGQAVNIRVTCASDSFKVDLTSDLVADGASFSGSWQESTRQAQGSVTGRIPKPGQFQASLQGVGFGVQISASSNSESQAVTIVSQGTDVQRVNITLRRA